MDAKSQVQNAPSPLERPCAAPLVWAFQAGVLPGLNVAYRLPLIDWLWALDHARAALVIAAAALVAGVLLGV